MRRGPKSRLESFKETSTLTLAGRLQEWKESSRNSHPAIELGVLDSDLPAIITTQFMDCAVVWTSDATPEEEARRLQHHALLTLAHVLS